MSNAVNHVQCPQCGNRMRYAALYAGKSAKCKKCGSKFRLPANQILAAPVKTSPKDPASGEDRPHAQLSAASEHQQALQAKSILPVGESTSEAQEKCARCGRSVDSRSDLYEFFAYRKTRTRFELGGLVYWFQETTTFEGLVELSGHACKGCVREIQKKYKLVWLLGLAVIACIAIGTIMLLPPNGKIAWDEPAFWIPVTGIVAGLFVFGTLGIVFPFFRFCVGQHIARFSPQSV
jgi:hypothetical protein